ncbi:MAG: hypothetical protein KBF93_17280 [Leptospiraceae bacterium]|nr:hypothetical protein [Leptospiraceae bacterium]
METDTNQEPSDSKFRKLTLDELKALPKEEVDEYMKWYVNDCDIYFKKMNKKIDEKLEKLEHFVNDCLDNPTDENLKKLERAFRSSFEQEEK